MLGGDINTEGKEVFLHRQQWKSLFSSNGHQGLGGLTFLCWKPRGMDLKICKHWKRRQYLRWWFCLHLWSKYRNRLPIFQPSRRKRKWRHLPSKSGSPPCDVNIDVTVVNEYTGAPLFGAVVSLYDTQENKLSTKSSAEDGSATLIAACDQEHLVQAGIGRFWKPMRLKLVPKPNHQPYQNHKTSPYRSHHRGR